MEDNENKDHHQHRKISNSFDLKNIHAHMYSYSIYIKTSTLTVCTYVPELAYKLDDSVGQSNDFSHFNLLTA